MFQSKIYSCTNFDEEIIMMMQQEDIEETARSELWREELIEEIEQKVGGLRELEEAGKK